jgi:hypothetical protein
MPMSPHRLAKAGILAVVTALLTVPAIALAAGNDAPKPPAPPGPQHPIVVEALKWEGKWGGQCFIFMQTVVEKALLREVGNDYHLGYLKAGAIEINLDQAGSGDIIQIIDPNYTEPDADYPGMHTLIVTENLGKGLVNGIDSNSQWDEMVRMRENYDPAAVAARYPNLVYRVYRFPTPDFPAPKAGSTVPPKTQSLVPGLKATVVAGGDTLNLRKAPGIDQAVAAELPDGTVVTVTSEAVKATGRLWVQVQSPYGSGWVAAEYLRAGASSSASAGGSTRPLFGYRSTVPFIAASGPN